MTPSERYMHNSKVTAEFNKKLAELFVEHFNRIEGEEAKNGFYEHAERSAKYIYLHVGEDLQRKAFVR
jgi:hypothetical protein